MRNTSKISPALDRELTLVSYRPNSSELRKLAEDNPENRNYIRKCLNAWVEVNDIIFEVKAWLALIELIWDNKELQELNWKMSTSPSNRHKIIRWYIRLKEMTKEIPDICICLKKIRRNPSIELINTCFEKVEKLFI